MDMKFQSYLKEEIVLHEGNIIEYLDKNCKKFLNEIKGNYIFRGIGNYQDYAIKTPRKDRLPRDLNQKLHDFYDEAFKRAFGWKVRSEGVFTTGSRTHMYGGIHLFFPIGNYKYLWSPKIYDLYGYTYELMSLDRNNMKDDQTFRLLKAGKLDKKTYKKLLSKAVKNIKDEYITKNLIAAKESGSEITFHCKKYLIVYIKSEMAKEIETIYGEIK